MKHLFIQQLEDIREVMLSKADHVLQMGVWFDDDSELTKHNTLDCGYAACVCGEMAVGGKLTNFHVALEDAGSPLLDLSRDVGEYLFVRVASSISYDLDRACVDLTGDYHNAASIYKYSSELRKGYAELDYQFTTKELDNLAHLNKEHPTAQDVADYIEVLIAKLVDEYGWGVYETD